jgi:predicted regulator of Ras-like GTPase activity (Roadblock/LC7/MglB family)
MVTKAEELLTSFKSENKLLAVFAASRSGVFIGGPVPDGKHRDTFVAMAAIIHGGAETTALEMNKPLKNVVVNFSDSQMLITTIGNRALLTIVAPKIDGELMERGNQLAKEIEGLV